MCHFRMMGIFVDYCNHNGACCTHLFNHPWKQQYRFILLYNLSPKEIRANRCLEMMEIVIKKINWETFYLPLCIVHIVFFSVSENLWSCLRGWINSFQIVRDCLFSYDIVYQVVLLLGESAHI